ncbi:MAG: hypothetical protein HQK76_07855 [Desulfobacterales bacterium]|nr:hypothetical protein [Desulfobacterales bacterium]
MGNKVYKLFLSLLIAFIFFITLSSCGLSIRLRSLFGGKLKVEVKINENVNLNSPVAVDMLIIKDEKLFEKLITMSSKEWFDKKAQIKKDFANGLGLDLWEWEWVPGQKIPMQKLPLRPKAKAGFIFADYFTEGVHRARFNPYIDIKLFLLEKDFLVEPLKKGNVKQ